MPTGRFSPHPVHPDPVTGELVKYCPDCGEDRPVTEFRTRQGGYLVSRCKRCLAAKSRRENAALTDEKKEQYNLSRRRREKERKREARIAETRARIAKVWRH